MHASAHYIMPECKEGPATFNKKDRWLGLVVVTWCYNFTRHIKRFKTAVATKFAYRECDWFKCEEQDRTW